MLAQVGRRKARLPVAKYESSYARRNAHLGLPHEGFVLRLPSEARLNAIFVPLPRCKEHSLGSTGDADEARTSAPFRYCARHNRLRKLAMPCVHCTCFITAAGESL